MAKKEGDSDRRKELEKDIMSYISTRRKKEGGIFKSISGIFRGGSDVNVKLHPEVEAYGEEKKAAKNEAKETEEEMEETAEELEGEFEEGAGQGIFSRIKNFFFEEESAARGEDVPPEAVEKVIEESRKKEEEAQEEEDDSELEEEYVEGTREKGIISSFLGRLFGNAKNEETACADEIAEAVVALDDLKRVAEISTHVMKMLPSDKVKELKGTDDFKNFKEILKKHNLIK